MFKISLISVVLSFAVSACSHSPVTAEDSNREPASADRCRLLAYKIFNESITNRLKPDIERVIFFDARPTTIAFFTFGWQRDLEASGHDRAFFIQFDRHCEVVNMGGGQSALEVLRQPQ